MVAVLPVVVHCVVVVVAAIDAPVVFARAFPADDIVAFVAAAAFAFVAVVFGVVTVDAAVVDGDAAPATVVAAAGFGAVASVAEAVACGVGF